MELIYWRHPTIPCIKVEEVSGGDPSKGKLWNEMARQLYCENGKDDYREIGHFTNGAPFLYGDSCRISITHCKGLFAVATLAPTPNVDLSEFNEISALGVDAERMDREQVVRVRDKFLSETEQNMIAADDIRLNVLAWTIKEASYKAALTPGLDFRNKIQIVRFPKIAPAVPVFDPKEFGLPKNEKNLPDDFFGKVRLEMDCSASGAQAEKKDEEDKALVIELVIYSYISDECIITLAYSPRSAVYGKS